MGDEYALEAPMKGFGDDSDFIEFEQHYHGWTTCPECETQFERKMYNQRYCTPECTRAARVERDNQAKRARRRTAKNAQGWKICGCFDCDKPFRMRVPNHKYCSEACGRRHREKMVYRITPSFLDCEHCDKPFVPVKNQRFCSRRCQRRSNEGVATKRQCRFCGKPFTLGTQRAFCSRACRDRKKAADHIADYYNRSAQREYNARYRSTNRERNRQYQRELRKRRRRVLEERPCAYVDCVTIFRPQRSNQRFCNPGCAYSQQLVDKKNKYIKRKQNA